MTGRIAVTGSSGHLGRAVVEDLLAHGYDVVGIDRTAVTDESRHHPRLGRTVGRARSPAGWTAATP